MAAEGGGRENRLAFYGTVITAIVTVCIPVTQGVIGYFERERTQIIADAQRELENNRAAASLYFDKMELRLRPDLNLHERETMARDLKIFAIVSGDEELQDIFQQYSLEVVADRRAAPQAGAPPGEPTEKLAPSAAFAGIPNLITPKTAQDYGAGDFLAYPQVPVETPPELQARFEGAVAGLGFKIQVTERMTSSPRRSQVRYYHQRHRALAAQAAEKLSSELGLNFEPALVSGSGSPPDGVMEFWIGSEAIDRRAGRAVS